MDIIFPCKVSHDGENLISVFEENFASIDKSFYFERKTAQQAIIQ